VLCFRVTREHRESLSKNAKTLCDRSKIKFRDIHNKYSKTAKKHDDVAEDTVHEVVELVSIVIDFGISSLIR
jgi:ribosome recycling factor